METFPPISLEEPTLKSISPDSPLLDAPVVKFKVPDLDVTLSPVRISSEPEYPSPDT